MTRLLQAIRTDLQYLATLQLGRHGCLYIAYADYQGEIIKAVRIYLLGNGNYEVHSTLYPNNPDGGILHTDFADGDHLEGIVCRLMTQDCAHVHVLVVDYDIEKTIFRERYFPCTCDAMQMAGHGADVIEVYDSDSDVDIVG